MRRRRCANKSAAECVAAPVPAHSAQDGRLSPVSGVRFTAAVLEGGPAGQKCPAWTFDADNHKNEPVTVSQ